LFLFIIQILYNISNRVKSKTTSAFSASAWPWPWPWPWQIILALVILGYIVFYKLIFVNLFSPMLVTIYSLVLNTGTSQNIQNETAVPLGYILYSLAQLTVCLIALYGLLVRSEWTYRLIQGLCLILIVTITGLLVFYTFSDNAATYLFSYLPIFVILLTIYMYSFSKSNKVKQFFGLNE